MSVKGFGSLFMAGAVAFGLNCLVAATTAQAQVRIVAIGDSGIRGKGVSEDEAYPAQLERALRARGHNVTVTNAGVNGDTSEGVLGRLDYDVPAGTQIAVISVGVNDVAKLGRSREEARAGVQTIFQRLRRRGVTAYNVSPFYRALARRPDLHVEANPVFGDYHLNAQGYAIVVAQSLPAIERLVKQAEMRGR